MCVAPGEAQEEEVLFLFSLSLELKPRTDWSPKEEKSRYYWCLRLELHQHWRLKSEPHKPRSRLSTYNLFACFLLFNVLESQQQRQRTVMVYKYPAWRGMRWFGRILLLG